MTKLLQKAFEAAAALPDEMQDQLATQLLQQLADEAKWDESLAASADELERMAREALEEYRAGRTEELGFDQL